MQLKIDIYGATIKIIILETIEDSEKYLINFNKKYKKNYEVYKFEGCCFPTDGRNFNLVLVKPFININLITHEVYHCSEFIADSCELTSTGNKEERAYLNAYINEKVVEHLKKLKITIFT